MDNLKKPFQCDLTHFIIDEIALEGLEGIGINLLWKRLAARISAPVTEKMKSRCWSFIVKYESISAYKLRKPAPDLEIIDRLTLVDPETGYMLDPDVYLDGPYNFGPVEEAYGSCANYNRRTLITDEIAKLSYEQFIKNYEHNKVVLVASLKERWRALAPQLPQAYLQHLGPIHFCMLELIGRSRTNGQMTTGKTNLTKIVKDPKLLFYQRKTLQELDLVRVTYVTQVTADRTIKSLMIRLKRFHKTDVLTIPKSGKIHDIVDYLRNQPSFCEKTDVVIKKGLMTSAQNKKFQKKVSIFHFEEQPITSEKMTPKEARKRHVEQVAVAPTPKETKPLDEKSTSKETPKKPVRKRYMYLVSRSDESSQSEDEEAPQPLKCQYKVGVNILRQAYERFLEAGRNGLTQNNLAQLIGVEFYVSRTICRIFKAKNIVREFMECKGRQRISRYIAIVATSKMEHKVAEEKEKLRKLLDEGHSLCKKEQGTEPHASSSDSEALIVAKKIKVEVEDKPEEINISEVEVIDGVRNAKRQLNLKSKKLTLRQLRFSSGILKVIHDKTFVLGYQTLSNLVAKEYNDTPMDTKAMKLLLQGLVAGGNLKIYKLKMPRSQNQFAVIICAPHIKPNHPLLKEKYTDLVQKITTNQNIQRKITSGYRPLSQYAFPRYVKVQKLHESLIRTVYLNEVKPESSDLPEGFISIKELIPELTVEVALGHITSGGVVDVSNLKLDDTLLNTKICNAPMELYRSLLNSKNLHASIRSTLKVLASFGLVHLIVVTSAEAVEFPDNTMAINWFYVNKYAKIIDTTGVWPRPNTDLKSLEREFHFDSFEAVRDYWQSVYIVSTNTTVDVPNRKLLQPIKPPARTKAQALALGKFGVIYGNGIGPCGFDSSFFIDMPRLWKSYCSRKLKLKQTCKPPINLPKFERPKRSGRIQKRKKNPIKKVMKKTEVVAEIVQKASHKHVNPKKKTREIEWTYEEDRILTMCKAAITIMSPISQPGCLQVRNLVAKDILSMRDPRKTQSICHRRALLIESNSTLTHERNCILNELRRNRLVSKYEGILKKIRILYCTHMMRYINEARLPMLELVWIIYQVSKNITLKQELPSEEFNIEHFHENYIIVPSSANRLCNLYRTPCNSEEDVVIATLKEAIVMTVMHSFNHVLKKSGAKTVYAYFRTFPEPVLRLAIEPLRKCGAIAAKDKLINAHMHIINLEDIVQCSYKISASYQRKWISRLNAEFVESLSDCFDGTLIKNAVKGAPETNCFCFELQAKDLIDIVALTVPVITGPSGSIIHEEQLNVIDIATNYKLKSGNIGWENKTTAPFSDAYKDIKIGDQLEHLTRRSFIYVEDVHESNSEHVVVAYLKTKCEKGASFRDLQENCNYEKKELIEILSELQNNNVIRRVGFYENVVVLMDFVKSWTMEVSGGRLMPLPWLTLKGEIRHEIFFKWAGVVVNKAFECPGCSIAYLSETAEFLTTRAVQDICESMQNCGCLTLHTLIVKEANLYSDDHGTNSELDDYNEFESPENIVVMPAVDCLVRYALLRNSLLNF